ncbi:MAG: hypothetical protein ACFCU2_05145 [Acidimicrobiia bacterium]
MTGLALIVFIGLLVGLFLVIAALVVWQESNRRPGYDPLTYVTEDAVKHVEAGLAGEGKAGLKRTDIRRIIEWEVFYLQGLGQKDRKNPVKTVAGGHESSVEYIVGQIEEKHGVTYTSDAVADVLRYEADYLTRIGAVGEAVDPDGGRQE